MAKYNSRLDKRAKKKSNVILNSLIAVVLVLIIAVGATIFLGNGTDRASEANTNTQDTNAEVADSSSSADEEESDTAVTDSTENEESETSGDEDSSEDSEDTNAENSSEDETDAEGEDKPVADGEELTDEEKKEKDKKTSSDTKKVVKESDEPNVKKVIVDPSWKPIGTVQTGEHVYEYQDTSAPDWVEKIDAFAYATGLSEDNMTVWWVERGGSDDEAIGTVAPKDQSTTYRVYLEWVDGKGWKPVKMQELVENDQN
jgi:phage pi2 protein 07